MDKKYLDEKDGRTLEIGKDANLWEISPLPKEPHGPEGWFQLLRNGVQVTIAATREPLERYATDPAYREELRLKETALHEREGFSSTSPAQNKS